MTIAPAKKSPKLNPPNALNIADYSVFKPQLPPEFYQWLASLCPKQNTAWDVLTGEGSVAVTLSEYFSYVIGTETHPEKLTQTLTYPRVEHGLVTDIEQLVKAHSLDLITLQGDWHALDLESFKQQLKTIAHQNTAMVLWRTGEAEISPALSALQNELIEFCRPNSPSSQTDSPGIHQHPWPEWNLTPIKSPRCQLLRNWTLQHFMDYLGCLKEVKNHFSHTGEDPRAEFSRRLTTAWGQDVTREVKWTAQCQAYRLDKL